MSRFRLSKFIRPPAVDPEIVRAAQESDAYAIADGLIYAANLLDINHRALKTRFQIAAQKLREQADQLKGRR